MVFRIDKSCSNSDELLWLALYLQNEISLQLTFRVTRHQLCLRPELQHIRLCSQLHFHTDPSQVKSEIFSKFRTNL